MAWSGGTYRKGNYSTNGWTGDASLGIGIEAGRHDTQDDDFMNGINQCLNKDGSNSATGNLNLGGYIPTNMAAGSAAAPALCVGSDINTGVFGPAADTWAVATNGVERLRIDSAGLIQETGANPVFNLENTSTTPADGGVLRFGHNQTSSKPLAEIKGQLVDGSVATRAGDLAFFTSAQATGTLTQKMVIRQDGKIGIGVTSPSSYVQITNNVSNAVNTLNVQSNVAGDAATHPLLVTKKDNNSTTGQVLVGFLMNGGATGQGQINANGASAAAFGSFSDVRLKENVVDLPSQIESICNLRPVEFDYKDGSGHQIGFIAQEVQAIYPDVIGESNGYLTLTDMNKNDARLIKAFQELYDKVKALEMRVAELEA